MPRRKKTQEAELITLPDKPFTEILVEMEIERIAGGEPGISVDQNGDPVETKFQNNVFRRKDDGSRVLIEEKHVKGMLKEVCRLLGLSTEQRGILFKIRHGIQVIPSEILIPPGTEIVVRTMPVLLGNRTSLVICETIEQPLKVSFKLRVLNKGNNEPIVDIKTLKLLFEQGQAVGIGAKRTLGYGKFKLLKFQVLN